MWTIVLVFDSNDEIGREAIMKNGRFPTRQSEYSVPFFMVGDAIKKFYSETCEEFGMNELGILKVMIER